MCFDMFLGIFIFAFAVVPFSFCADMLSIV